MDENNGGFASGQSYPAGQAAGPSQQQFQQQAPMVSAQDAYAPQGFAANAIPTQLPSNIYNLGLQQDFQASNSMDASLPASQYAQPTQAPVAQSSLASSNLNRRILNISRTIYGYRAVNCIYR